MDKLLFVFGLSVAIAGAALSYYPEFQDFDKTDYTTPFYKHEDYPDERDLIIMNVFADCGIDGNIFENYEKNGRPLCEIAANWIVFLLVLVLAGTATMCIAAVKGNALPKIKKK